MKCALFLVRNSPPFSILRQIVTATNIDRSRLIDGPGQLQFQVSVGEGLSVEALLSGLEDGHPMQPDTLREGVAIIDWSTEEIRPTLWYAQTARFDTETGYVDIAAAEWRTLLRQRVIPPKIRPATTMPAALAAQLLDLVNGRNPTHIVPDRAVRLGTRLLLGGLDVSDRDAEAAFTAIAEAGASEWWVDYGITWRSCRPKLQWAYRRGRDKRGAIELSEGVHLNAVTYARDAREVPRTIRFLNASNQRSAILSVGAGGLSTSAGQSPGSTVAPASEPDRRRIARFQSGPAMQNELIDVLPSADSDFVLLGAALRKLRTPTVAFQSIELSVRKPPDIFTTDNIGTQFETSPSRPLWGALDVGDIFTARLASPHFLAGVDIDVRIRGMQPDEASGEMILNVEIYG